MSMFSTAQRLAAMPGAIAAPPAVSNTEYRSASAWFDAEAPANIQCAVSPEARGLCVEDHVRRVLMHLIVPSDAAAA